jgi:hypothetical protein
MGQCFSSGATQRSVALRTVVGGAREQPRSMEDDDRSRLPPRVIRAKLVAMPDPRARRRIRSWASRSWRSGVFAVRKGSARKQTGPWERRGCS